MSGKTTLKLKSRENDSEENEMRSLNKQPDIMDWQISLLKREHLLRLEVETEASYERSDLTPLGETLSLGHLVKEVLSRYYFMDFASLLDTRAKWARCEIPGCFPRPSILFTI